MTYYTIYKVTNKINGKIYIGSHKTKNLNDNYMGSGKYLSYAFNKHGIENFTKEILYVFDTPELMYAKEAELVNEEFLATENTYNLKIGGFGGWDYVNKNKLSGFFDPEVAKRGRKITDSILLEKHGSDWRAKLASMAGTAAASEEVKAKIKATRKLNGTYGKVDHLNTEAVKKKRKDSFTKIGHQQGEKNSQFGTMWIHSLEEKKSKKINKGEVIPEGWLPGRKIKF